MAEQGPTHARPTRVPNQARAGTSLPSATGDAPVEAADQDDRLDVILSRGDVRDQAAERRDRLAERRPRESGDGQARVDRDWAGRDRDAAAIDRAELVGLMEAREPEPPSPVALELD